MHAEVIEFALPHLWSNAGGMLWGVLVSVYVEDFGTGEGVLIEEY